MDELNHLGWVVYKTYEIGGYVFGIRTNNLDAGEWLEHTLAAYEVTDEESEPYFSLWVPEQTGGPAKQYYVLYRESDDMVRTLDPAKLAQRLLAELETFALRRRTDGIFLDACVVERGGAHALVPSAIIPYIRLAGRRVERELTLPVIPTVGVTPDGCSSASRPRWESPRTPARTSPGASARTGASTRRRRRRFPSRSRPCARSTTTRTTRRSCRSRARWRSTRSRRRRTTCTT
jgi:hypothetical protein